VSGVFCLVIVSPARNFICRLLSIMDRNSSRVRPLNIFEAPQLFELMQQLYLQPSQESQLFKVVDACI